MRKQIEVLEIETKSKEVKLHSTAVQLTQKEAELERALGKMSDLQTQVALLNADVDNNKVLIVCDILMLNVLSNSETS